MCTYTLKVDILLASKKVSFLLKNPDVDEVKSNQKKNSPIKSHPLLLFSIVISYCAVEPISLVKMCLLPNFPLKQEYKQRYYLENTSVVHWK